MTKKTMIIIAIICVAAAALVAGGIYYFKNFKEQKEYYAKHFFQETYINGTDVSGKTIKEVEEMLIPDVSDYSMEIQFRNDDTETIKGSDIDFQATEDGGIKSVFLNQPEYKMFQKFERSDNKIKIRYIFDETKLGEIIDEMPELQEENMIEPKAEDIVFHDGKFELVPGEEGTIINKETFLDAVKEALKTKSARLNISQNETIYKPIEGKRTKEEVETEIEELNKYCATTITYTLPSGPIVLDGNTLKTWLDKDIDGHYKKRKDTWDEKVREFLNNLQAACNTIGAPREFKTTSGETVTVQGGNYGNELNWEEEYKLLNKQLEEGGTYERDPVYSIWEVSKENNGIGNTYVEVDLSKQHLWYYVDGEVILESDLVSGLPTEKRITPEGVFLVWEKQSPAVLVGEKDANGVPEYRTTVDYWMAFNGGIGFHDAVWQPAFGGDMWLTNGSHGCINLPYSTAQAMYGMMNYNTPIVCFYSEPYTLY